MRSSQSARLLLLLLLLILLPLWRSPTPISAAADQPFAGDALHPPRHAPTFASASSSTPALDQPSSFMAGRVAVQLIFVASNGTAEPTTERWSADQITSIQGHISAALGWWHDHLPNAQLDFDLTASVVASRYEPITHTLNSEGLWIGDVLARLGYSGATYFDQAYAADDALRRVRHTDWATTIFVVNSAADEDGRFADNFFAYAYIGGPFMVITSDVGLYGTQQMTPIIAHEFGHIFGALDQYAAASVPCSQMSGYLAIPTTNSQYTNCGSHFNSIMLDPIPAYSDGVIDAAALGQIGYRDADGNGRPDPLDTQPVLDLTLDQPPAGSRPKVTGSVFDQPYPALLQQSVTINTITLVEYQIDGGPWLALPAADGSYDSAAENLAVSLPLYDGQHQIGLRARNSAGAFSPMQETSVTVQDVGAAPPYQVAVPALSNTTTITLELGAPADSSAQISEDPFFAGAVWSPVVPTTTLQLTADDGPHTLYVRFRDSAGRESPPIARTVLLDRDPPQGHPIIRPGSTPLLELQAYDDGSGITAIGLGSARDTLADWQAFQPAMALPQGTTSIWVRLRDAAGNVSQPQLAHDSYLIYLPLIRSP
jgi:hypothetical protein